MDVPKLERRAILGRVTQVDARRPWPLLLHLLVCVLAALGTFAVPVGSALALRRFVLEAFLIPAGSMIPALEIGDHIFVNKMATRPGRGDIVVFRFPLDPEVSYIKRVVGLPGDTVELRGEVLLVNGEEATTEVTTPCPARQDVDTYGRCTLREEKLDGQRYAVMLGAGRPAGYGPIKVPADGYFVLGDNRDNSNDSRVWGFVPEANIQGRALFVWWSSAPGGNVRFDRFLKAVR
jgi:signal peptidase I